jgi:hypothetical protein
MSFTVEVPVAGRSAPRMFRQAHPISLRSQVCFQRLKLSIPLQVRCNKEDIHKDDYALDTERLF